MKDYMDRKEVEMKQFLEWDYRRRGKWLFFCQLSIIEVPKAMKHQGSDYMNQLLLQTEITIRLQPINLKPIVS